MITVNPSITVENSNSGKLNEELKLIWTDPSTKQIENEDDERRHSPAGVAWTWIWRVRNSTNIMEVTNVNEFFIAQTTNWSRLEDKEKEVWNLGSVIQAEPDFCHFLQMGFERISSYEVLIGKKAKWGSFFTTLQLQKQTKHHKRQL